MPRGTDRSPSVGTGSCSARHRPSPLARQDPRRVPENYGHTCRLKLWIWDVLKPMKFWIWDVPKPKGA